MQPTFQWTNSYRKSKISNSDKYYANTNQGDVVESDWWLLYLGVQKGLPEKMTLMLRFE